MRLKALVGSLTIGLSLSAGVAPAAQFGAWEVTGFLKDEFSTCDNCSLGLVNPSTFDPRGVLTIVNPMLNQGGESGDTSANLGLVMLTVGYAHEFDNAVKVEGRVTGRMRNNEADIFDNWVIDAYAGVVHPRAGSLHVGKMASRSWTRSDSFAYPVGLSSPWAESGAGYGVFPQAVRYATREFETAAGKLRFEATLARAKRRAPINVGSAVTRAPSPELYEIFVQFSNEKNLVELVYQDSEGGRQSSFSKGAFYGAQGDTNGPAGSPGYRAPTESVLILQGTHWFNPQWRVSYGVKHNRWSGQQQQCDYGPVSAIAFACYWDQPGFNYANDGKLYSASTTDLMGGVAYTRGLWTFTAGGVLLRKASTDNPTEWGQSNMATFTNLGVYRKLPEVYKDLEVYGGIGRVEFDRRGPAPLSMPNNTAFFGADPRTAKSALGFTIGANLKF